MMKMALLKTHYTAEEAYSMLMLLDELRDAVWNNYRDEIIEHCHHQQRDNEISSGFDDDIIPF